MPTIRSISEFRQKATAMIQEVNESDTPLILTHNGREAAVVVSPRKWKEAQDMKSMLQVLQLSENTAEAGKAVGFDDALDVVEAMIDAHGR